MNDTILVRLDIPALTKIVESRFPEHDNAAVKQLLEKTIAALQRHIENEAEMFSRGEGYFETCLFEAQ